MPCQLLEPAHPPAAERGPVRETMLPYGRQVVGEAEEAAVLRVLRSDFLTQGPETARFESLLCRACGARHAVAMSSGTTALHASLAALGIGPGDEVIVPAVTFIATCNAVLYTGARPVVVDVEPDTLNLCPQAAERAIGPATRAIVVVHYAGHPADMDALSGLAEQHGLAVVEDAAHALGAFGLRRGEMVAVGSDPATLATFSFHPVKAITTAEGGAVTTSSSFVDGRLRTFRHHGIDRGAVGRAAEHDRICSLGVNGRMSELQAALGRVQLGRLAEFLARRRSIARSYQIALRGCSGLDLPVERPGCQSAWHLFPIQLRLDRLRTSRRAVVEALRCEGIGAQVHYVPLHLHPHVQHRARMPDAGLPVADAAAARVLSLPLWPGMSDADVDDVIRALLLVLDREQR